MSKSLNVFSFTGHLGGDPNLHTFDDGTMVANLRVAIARQVKDKSGQWIDEPVWVEAKAWGKQAEAIGEYLAKGSFVAVTGELAQPRLWEDNNGVSRVSIVVDRASVTFGPRSDNGSGQRQSQPARQAAPASRMADDDIPF